MALVEWCSAVGGGFYLPDVSRISNAKLVVADFSP
ncbi:hypothetical protein QOZ96_001410 [Brevundimonas nasdae]|nr:hypothetical protein [Brevundimonas nasdae]